MKTIRLKGLAFLAACILFGYTAVELQEMQAFATLLYLLSLTCGVMGFIYLAKRINKSKESVVDIYDNAREMNYRDFYNWYNSKY